MNLPENKMSVLKRIGIPIVEHCNLKCKGCLHFCNSNQEEFYYDCEEFERDVMCKFRFIGSPIPVATDQCFRS